MPGADERVPGDPNRPPVGKVGDEMQKMVDDLEGPGAPDEDEAGSDAEQSTADAAGDPSETSRAFPTGA